MKKHKLLVLVFTTLFMTVSIVGCGGKDNLDEFFKEGYIASVAEDVSKEGYPKIDYSKTYNSEEIEKYSVVYNNKLESLLDLNKYDEYSTNTFTRKENTGFDKKITVTINDKHTLSFPSTLTEMIQNGIYINESYKKSILESDIKGNTGIGAVGGVGDNTTCILEFFNNSDTTCKIDECMLSGIRIAEGEAYFKLSNGLSNESTIEEIIDTMGEPDQYTVNQLDVYYLISLRYEIENEIGNIVKFELVGSYEEESLKIYSFDFVSRY